MSGRKLTKKDLKKIEEARFVYKAPELTDQEIRAELNSTYKNKYQLTAAELREVAQDLKL